MALTQQKPDQQSNDTELTAVVVDAPEDHGRDASDPPISGDQDGAGLRSLSSDDGEQSMQGRVTALDRWLIQRVFEIIGQPRFTLVLWDGQVAYGGEWKDVPKVTLRDRGVLWRLLVDPELYFGDLYTSGRIRFEGDLARFLVELFDSMAGYGAGNSVRRFLTGLVHNIVGNTLDRAKHNIYHHYDLSNDFYQKWLDTEAMQYTCLLYTSPSPRDHG